MKNRLILTLLLACLAFQCQAYMFVDNDLSEIESSPGVAIIYPRAIGPEIPDDLEAKESTESVVTVTTDATNTVANAETSSVETTTSVPTTLGSNEAKTETETAASSSSAASTSVSTSTATTTTTTASPNDDLAASELPASASAPSSVYVPRPRPNEPLPAVNRVWHFNNRGVNSEAAWARVDRDSEAVESHPSPVYAGRANLAARSQPMFFRKPVFASEPAESNSLTADGDLAVGEYAPNNQRNLYYPEINRIQAPTSSSASASAAASASASASASSNGFQPAPASINAAYGTKGGPSPFLGNTWQPMVPSPVKAVRKVVKTAKTYSESEAERSQGFHSSQQPYRVRVVVQPNTKTVQAPAPAPAPQPNYQQNNYFERIQESRASAAASAAASSSAFTKKTSTSSALNQLADQKEYVEVSKVNRIGTKTPPPPPPAAIKSPPPPPAPVAAIKTPPPRPAPIKQQPIKSPPPPPVRAAIRAPVFEQETEQQHYEELHNPEPEPYSFNFNVNDDSGNGQFRREEGDRNGVVRGSYGYTDAWGLYRIVDYVADKNGFRATIRTNEPGLVERNPVTNEVDNPAHIQVAAEETPAKVVELMRLKKPDNNLL